MHATTAKITLVGAGLAGSLLAIFLAKRGLQVEVYEQQPDLRTVARSAARSINLALSTRSIHALRQLDLDGEILPQAIPMRGRMIHLQDGDLRFQPYGRDETEVLYAISRAGLNKTLLNTAEKYPAVHIHFNEQCRGFHPQDDTLHLRHTATGAERSIPTERIIGTDGSASTIRTSMLCSGRYNFSQQYLEHGYKELILPPGPDDTWQIDSRALHIWPRSTYMLIALPNLDGSFTCTLFLPFEGDNSFAGLSSEENLLAFFHRQFPDFVPLMPNLAEEFFAHPTGSLATIKCFPWYVADKILLLGDAAHAIVPFYGQGMNCAFEDCTYLDACIAQYWPDWGKIFQTFTNQRKEHTDAIADMAVSHYVEMRDDVAHPAFLLQKQVERTLEQKYPDRFIPKYSLVTFHRVPYAVARHQGDIQEEVLRELCAGIETIEQVDWDKAARLISSL